MAETSGSLTTVVSRRVRDPNNTAHAALDVRNLFTHAQRIINAHTQAVLAEEDLSLTSGRVILSTLELTAIDKVLTVRLDDRDLPCVPWRSLAHYDPYWLTTLGTPQFWAPIGRMLFAIVPGLFEDRTITVVGTKVTGSLSSAATATELRDPHMPAMLNLVEQVLLMRHRLFTSAKITDDRRPAISRIGEL